MSRHQSDARSQATSGDPTGRRRRTGTFVGPVRVTPVRVTLLVALAGGLAFLLWSVIVRDQLQVPLMATGFAVCGIVFAAIAVLAVPAVVRAGREGRDGTAVLTALVGGMFAVISFMSIAAAVIMSLIWGGTPGA